jgi:hypothetical protein
MDGYLTNTMMYLLQKVPTSMILSSKETMTGTILILHSKSSFPDKPLQALVLCNTLNTAKTDTQKNGNPKQKDNDRSINRYD